MDKSPPRAWIGVAALVGLWYALVGITFAVPTTHAQAWRLAAWGVSAVAYGAHLLYERVRKQHTPSASALHVAAAAAVGGFGLAVGANVHSLSVESTQQHRQLLLLSLAIWPVVTGIPAYLVALVASVILRRTR